MRKKRTTEERYGKGYSDYVRIYTENVETHAHKTDKRAQRTLKPMLSKTEYQDQIDLRQDKLDKINKARREQGLKEVHSNINKEIIDYQSFELTEKRGKVLQKVMGKQLAEEKYIKKLKKEHPELSMDEMERMAASADLKPEYVPLSWVRAGEQLSESKFKESIAEFWDDVSSERASKVEEYMAQGYSRAQANKMASMEIGRTFFDSE